MVMTITHSADATSARGSKGGVGNASGWPLVRVLFALAGAITLLSVVLTLTVSMWFALLAAFVAVNQWLYVVAGAGPASIILRRACHLHSAAYANPEAATAPQQEVTV